MMPPPTAMTMLLAAHPAMAMGYGAPSRQAYGSGVPVMQAPPMTDPALSQALQLVAQIRNLPRDEANMHRLGVDLIFRNGQEAVDLIRTKGIQVVFGDMGDSEAHAQWLAEQNTIMINQRYRGNPSRDNLFAIAEAIYHEAGHAARNGDGEASIQEEFNCLALNTMAHGYHEAIDPGYAQSGLQSRLMQDGVKLYRKLFDQAFATFDPSVRQQHPALRPGLQPLIGRVLQKYGMLPVESADHRVPPPVPVAPGFNQAGRGQLPFVDQLLRQAHNTQIQQYQWMA